MIRDFVGLSENSWDLNAPGAMAGFGPIDKDEVARLVMRLLGEPDATAVAAHPPTSPSQTDNHTSESGQARGIQAIPGSAGPVPAPDQQPQQLDTTSAANDVTSAAKPFLHRSMNPPRAISARSRHGLVRAALCPGEPSVKMRGEPVVTLLASQNGKRSETVKPFNASGQAVGIERHRLLTTRT